MIKALSELEGIPFFGQKGWGRELTELMTERNLLAHGTWCRHPDYPANKRIYVRATTGNWFERDHPLHDTSRAIKPEAIYVNAAYLANWNSRIDEQIKALKKLEKRIVRALKTSRKKRP